MIYKTQKAAPFINNSKVKIDNLPIKKTKNKKKTKNPVNLDAVTCLALDAVFTTKLQVTQPEIQYANRV